MMYVMMNMADLMMNKEVDEWSSVSSSVSMIYVHFHPPNNCLVCPNWTTQTKKIKKLWESQDTALQKCDFIFMVSKMWNWRRVRRSFLCSHRYYRFLLGVNGAEMRVIPEQLILKAKRSHHQKANEFSFKKSSSEICTPWLKQASRVT